MRVKAENLKVGDVVGSGEIVESIEHFRYPMNEKLVRLALKNPRKNTFRVASWLKKTLIGVTRDE